MLDGDASSTGLPLSLAGDEPVALAGRRRTDREQPGQRTSGSSPRRASRPRRRRPSATWRPTPTAPPRPASSTSRSSRRRPRRTQTRRPSRRRSTPGRRRATSSSSRSRSTVSTRTATRSPSPAVTVPPTLGRIVAIGPDSISYQSYPDSSGHRHVHLPGHRPVRADRHRAGAGRHPAARAAAAAGRGRRRASSAPPGATLHWNVLGNDFIAPGDTATVEPLSKTNTSRAGRGAPRRVVRLPPGAVRAADAPVTFTYGDTDGVRAIARPGHRARGARRETAADREGRRCSAARGGSAHRDGRRAEERRRPGRLARRPAGSAGRPRESPCTARSLVIPVTPSPREVPYQVSAPDGLTATAVVYVPGTQAPQRSGSSQVRGSRSGRTARLPSRSSSVLLDTSGRQLKITTVDQLGASPAGDLTSARTPRPPSRSPRPAGTPGLARSPSRSTTAPPCRTRTATSPP